MTRVKIFDFDLEKVTMTQIETELNTYVNDLAKTSPGIKYEMLSMGYLKFWRIVIYF